MAPGLKLPPETVLEATTPGACHQTVKACLKYGQFSDILGHLNTIVRVRIGKTFGSRCGSECVRLAAPVKYLFFIIYDFF